MSHVNFYEAVTNSSRKNDNYKNIYRLLAKIILLDRNSKIRPDENLPGCLDVLHTEFHDAPTSNEND